MIPAVGETYTAKVYKRVKDSDYQWEDTPYCTFKCRPASQMEKKKYRIQKGVNGNTDSIFLYATNLPDDISIKDKVKFMGKEWTLESTGYYFDASHIVNASILTEEQIIARCPKGVNLQ